MPALFQHAFYIGNNFNAILYGIELVLYFLTMRALSRRSPRGQRNATFFMLFSTAILCLNTVFVATEAVFGEEMWIANNDYPGGQDAYLADFASVWYQSLGTAASILLNLLSDALMIYRCYIIWADFRIVVFPCLLYLGTFSVGIAQLAASGQPHGNYFAGLAHRLGVAYTSTLISLEVLVTALICARIAYVARLHARQQQPAGARLGYVSALAIVVESALPLALLGVAYLVTFARGSDLSIFFLSVYVMSTCISPQMIILRVVSGSAWTVHTTETILTSAPLDYPDARAATLSTAIVVGIESAHVSQCKDGDGVAEGYLPTEKV